MRSKNTADNHNIFAEVQKLVSHLKSTVFEQQNAIEDLADALLQMEYKPSDKNGAKAIFTFIGPPSSGKIALAGQLAKSLTSFEASKIFDMSQYPGAEDGYSLLGNKDENRDQQQGEIINFITQHPDSVIIFEDFEKAHIQTQLTILNLITSSSDYELDISGIVFIFVTTLGKSFYLNNEFMVNYRKDKIRLQTVLMESLCKEKKAVYDSIQSAVAPKLLSLLSQNQVILFQKPGFNTLVKIGGQQVKSLTPHYIKRTGINIEIKSFETLISFLTLSLSPYLNSMEVKKIPELLFGKITEFIKRKNEVPQKVVFAIPKENKMQLKEKFKDFGELAKELIRKNEIFSLKWNEVYENKILQYELVNAAVKKMPDLSSLLTSDDFPLVQYSDIEFRDIAGQKKIKNALREIIQILKEPKQVEKFRINMPKGILLHGPEGVGKAMLAQAFAKEADLPYIRISGSLLFDPVHVFQVYEKARENAPCIVFLDGLDVKGVVEGGMVSPVPAEQIVTELEAITDEKVFTIATAVSKAEINPALTSPGRIDIFIEVPELDKEARKFYIYKILKKPNDGKINVDRVAHYISGMNAVDLARLERDVSLHVIRNSLERITEDILIEQINIIKYGHKLESNRLRNFEQDLKKTAYHEAGHAILSMILQPEIKIEQVTISPRSETLGFVSYNIEESLSNTSKEELQNNIYVLLAGRVAKLKKFGDGGMDSGAINDLEQATAHAYYAISSFGMDEELGFISVGLINEEEEIDILSGQIEERLLKWMERSKKKTEELVTQHWHKIETLAKELIENEVVEGTELERIIREE